MAFTRRLTVFANAPVNAPATAFAVGVLCALTPACGVFDNRERRSDTLSNLIVAARNESDRGRPASARPLYERALALDDTNREALLGLAYATLEVHGYGVKRLFHGYLVAEDAAKETARDKARRSKSGASATPVVKGNTGYTPAIDDGETSRRQEELLRRARRFIDHEKEIFRRLASLGAPHDSSGPARRHAAGAENTALSASRGSSEITARSRGPDFVTAQRASQALARLDLRRIVRELEHAAWLVRLLGGFATFRDSVSATCGPQPNDLKGTTVLDCAEGVGATAEGTSERLVERPLERPEDADLASGLDLEIRGRPRKATLDSTRLARRSELLFDLARVWDLTCGAVDPRILEAARAEPVAFGNSAPVTQRLFRCEHPVPAAVRLRGQRDALLPLLVARLGEAATLYNTAFDNDADGVPDHYEMALGVLERALALSSHLEAASARVVSATLEVVALVHAARDSNGASLRVDGRQVVLRATSDLRSAGSEIKLLLDGLAREDLRVQALYQSLDAALTSDLPVVVMKDFNLGLALLRDAVQRSRRKNEKLSGKLESLSARVERVKASDTTVLRLLESVRTSVVMVHELLTRGRAQLGQVLAEARAAQGELERALDEALAGK